MKYCGYSIASLSTCRLSRYAACHYLGVPSYFFQQVHTFYEAVGYMISAQPNKPQQEKLISKLMELPNNAVCTIFFIIEKSFAHDFIKWDSLMAQAAQNMDVLSNLDNIKILSNVLKTNVSACTSIGSFYLPQVGRVFLDMLGLYKAVSGIISETVAREGS
jgi:exportin-1